MSFLSFLLPYEVLQSYLVTKQLTVIGGNCTSQPNIKEREVPIAVSMHQTTQYFCDAVRLKFSQLPALVVPWMTHVFAEVSPFEDGYPALVGGHADGQLLLLLDERHAGERRLVHVALAGEGTLPNNTSLRRNISQKNALRMMN